MNTDSLRDLIVQGLRDQIRVRTYRGGFLITTPITLASGVPFQLRADVRGDQVTLSDEGQVAQELDVQGFDVTSPKGKEHWGDILRSLDFAPALNAEPWELSMCAPVELLGAAVSTLADAAAHGDALRVFAKSYRPANIRERVIRAVHDLAPRARINPRAEMTMRAGGRRLVSFSATQASTAFVQTISSAQGPNDGYDKALGTFSHAAPPIEQRVVVFDGPLTALPQWQRDGIGEVARLVSGADVEAAARAILASTR